MIKIINFANIFYGKRFILEKEARIDTLSGYIVDFTQDVNFIDVIDEDISVSSESL